VGDYRLKVLLIPGHTPGSIALLEEKHKFLISGDSVQSGTVFMHGKGRNLNAYYYSMMRLQKMYHEGAFDTVYPSHGELCVGADIIEDHVALAKGVLNGSMTPIGPGRASFAPTVMTYGYGKAKLYYDKGE